jgi:hypothetical protein
MDKRFPHSQIYLCYLSDEMERWGLDSRSRLSRYTEAFRQLIISEKISVSVINHFIQCPMLLASTTHSRLILLAECDAKSRVLRGLSLYHLYIKVHLMEKVMASILIRRIDIR